jgi:hypothetical protein
MGLFCCTRNALLNDHEQISSSLGLSSTDPDQGIYLKFPKKWRFLCPVSSWSGQGSLTSFLRLALIGQCLVALCPFYITQQYFSLAPSLTGEAVCPSERHAALQAAYPSCDRLRISGGPLLAATSRSCKFYNPSVFALRLTHLGMLVTGKFTRIWGFHSSPTASEQWPRVSTQT